jgi:hypothetical protein
VDGTITTIDPPGSTDTHALGITRSGSIVGYYLDSNKLPHDYERLTNGKYKTFEVTDATATYGLNIDSSNADNHAIVGVYHDNAGVPHGYIRDAK